MPLSSASVTFPCSCRCLQHHLDTSSVPLESHSICCTVLQVRSAAVCWALPLSLPVSVTAFTAGHAREQKGIHTHSSGPATQKHTTLYA
jgi:hypothetical protein